MEEVSTWYKWVKQLAVLEHVEKWIVNGMVLQAKERLHERKRIRTYTHTHTHTHTHTQRENSSSVEVGLAGPA